MSVRSHVAAMDRVTHRSPDGAMLGYIPVAPRDVFDDREPVTGQGPADRATKTLTVARTGKSRTEKAGGSNDIQASRCSKESFKGARIEQAGLRQEGKNSAAVVVEVHDGAIENEESGGEETVEIVVEGEVPDNEDGRCS